jgi:hypothetical protein
MVMSSLNPGNPRMCNRKLGASLLMTALTLPAVTMVHADVQPDYSLIAFKYLDYRDSQPGLDRIKVTTPALSLMTPVASDYSLTANLVVDSISGASPAYHTQSLTGMRDERRASDFSLTRYLPLGTLTVGLNYSNESDYVSRGLSVGATRSTEDKNTTWNVGLNLASDAINPSNRIVSNETKDVQEISLGLTQVLSKTDIAQIIWGYSHGTGYFSDPYKVYDNRPRERDHNTLLGRWNHYIGATDGSLRMSYRYYSDSYDIRAHTLSAEYVQPLAYGWTVTPMLRIYSQTSAGFYVDVDPLATPFPTHPPATATYFTEDQRLSAFGARSLGLKVTKEIDAKWKVDFKVDRYEQQSAWSFTGSGSPGLDPMVAVSYQIGISRRF